MRGGSSKGLFFHARDLPTDRQSWDRIFLSAIGSPDPYGRQLNGMGGGISSLSKVAVIAPSTRDDSDVDFTFGQVVVDQPVVDYGSTCGNLTSAAGVFAVDKGLLRPEGPEAKVRIYNTNTGKIAVARFPLDGESAAVKGDLQIAGVAGSGATIRLDFLDPGGGVTGKLLPSNQPVDELEVEGLGRVSASLVDATNPCVFVHAENLRLSGAESPYDLEKNAVAMRQLEAIRAVAGVAMGLGETPEDVSRHSKSSPKVAVLAPPRDMRTLSGDLVKAEEMDIVVRMLSMGVPHRAVPLTGALCLAVAAAIPGSLANLLQRNGAGGLSDLRISTPSGVVPVKASVGERDGEVQANSATAYRTARALMHGNVMLPGS